MPAGTKIFYISGLSKNKIGAPISYNSAPQYDGWGPGDYWSCAQWVEYHKALKQHYGANQAIAIWSAAWAAQDSFAGPYNWCKYSTEFAQYFANEGIDVGWLLSHIVTGVDQVATGVVHTTVNVASGAENVSKVLKYAAPLAVFGIGAWGFNKYVKKIF